MDKGIIIIGRFNKDGSVDTSFGVNGFTQFQFPGSVYAWLNSIDIQEDGKILVGGEQGVVDNGPSFVARFNADGNIDATFGNGGIFIFRELFTPYGRVISLRSLPNGKILTFGSLGGIGGDPLLLYRLNSDGSIDTSFGTNGYVYDHFGPQYDIATDMAIQSDGKIVVTGYTIADWLVGQTAFVIRYNPDGTRDTNFAINGLYTMPNQYIQSNTLYIQSNSNIIMAGGVYENNKYNAALWKLTANGVLESSFGRGGSYTFPLETDGFFYQILPTNDGSFIGTLSNSINPMKLVRFMVDSFVSTPTISPMNTQTPTISPTLIPTVMPTSTPVPSLSPVIRKGVTIDNNNVGNARNANDKWQYFGSSWAHTEYSLSNNVGDYAILTFTGKKIALYGIVCAYCGKASISFDGQEERIIDTYNTSYRDNELIWISQILKPGKHILKISVIDEKNTFSESNSIGIRNAIVVKGESFL